jgi:putative oxygen-independent coproporphyrinogen III oxidase
VATDGRSAGGAGLGVYVHIPFCASRCDYCAFAIFTDRRHLATAYVDACLQEVESHLRAGCGPAATVYFGGGTPSQLAGSELARLLAGIDRLASAEVTVECNPGDVSAELLATYAEAGVTRISLGVQSLVPHVLECLGRCQHTADVARAVEAIGDAGFASFSVDLIYGAVAESDDDWERTLRGVLEWSPAPSHVSAYALQAEPGTPLWRDRSRHPDDDVQAGRYETAESLLSAAGLRWYEISNWARPGHECRHNWNYWRQGEYLGIGCAAHGHVGGRRYWNVRTPERYVAAVSGGRSPVAGEERLGDRERRHEARQLALRTRDGVATEAFAEADWPDLTGLVERNGPQTTLTLRGRLLANEVACRLV